MKRIVFRFDVDTHKCIRDGVPNLLRLGETYQTGFSFFLNAGKAVSLTDSVRDIISRGGVKSDSEEVLMMSARQKLGTADYVKAAFLNPDIACYKTSVRKLYHSRSEMGIHGGRNHMIWHKHADQWTRERLESEIDWALAKIRNIIPEYKPKGFASPGWTGSPMLEEVLARKGFLYCADYRCRKHKNVRKEGRYLPYLGVNLLGEPGGVAFFEHCRMRGLSSKQIIQFVMDSIRSNEVTVVYDHPYYAGIRELNCIGKIIEMVTKSEDMEIVTLEKLIAKGV